MTPATEFSFYPPDHSVVQAHYEQGCIPFESAGGGKPGFYSGPQIVSGASDEVSEASNSSRPGAAVPWGVWYSLASLEPDLPRRDQRHGAHLLLLRRQGLLQGQAHDRRHQPCEPVPLPPELLLAALTLPPVKNKTQTLEGHLGFVEQAEFQLLPGEDWPSEAPDDEGGDAKSGSGSASALANSTGSSPSLSSGAIAGIVIGGAAVLIAAAALIYLCGRRGGKDHACGRSLPVPWGNGGSRAPASPFGFGSGVEQESAPPMSMGTGQEWSPRLVSPALGGPGYAIAAQQQAFGVPVGPHLTGTSVSG